MKVLEPSPPPARSGRDGGRGRRDGGRGGVAVSVAVVVLKAKATLNVVKAVKIVHVAASMTNHVANVLHLVKIVHVVSSIQSSTP